MRPRGVQRTVRVVILAALPLMSASAGAQVPSSAVDDPEAYAVYRSVVGSLVDGPLRVRRVTHLVLGQLTLADWDRCIPSGKPFETEWRPVLNDFKKENSALRLLRPGFSFGVPYTLVPAADYPTTALALDTDPGAFELRYPNAGGVIFHVSAVGFDEAGTRAMVVISYQCGIRCGTWSYYLLKKLDGRWVFAELEGVLTCSWMQ
jgi:hypothetical protein